MGQELKASAFGIWSGVEGLACDSRPQILQRASLKTGALWKGVIISLGFVLVDPSSFD